MTIHRQSIDNSSAIKKAEEFFKDWTFENIFLDINGDIMEDDKEETVFLYASTDTVGSECNVDMGYTLTEWRNFTEEEKTDIINEFMANVCNIYVATEKGDYVD